MHTTDKARELWAYNIAENFLQDFLLHESSTNEKPPFRISFGIPPNKKASAKSAKSACLLREQSSDGYNEIYINPTIEDSHEICARICIELLHALFDVQGYPRRLARIAYALGFEAPLKDMKAGDELKEYFDAVLSICGNIPAGAVKATAVAPAGKSRTYAVECLACGFKFAVSKKRLEQIREHADCLCCGENRAMIATVPAELDVKNVQIQTKIKSK